MKRVMNRSIVGLYRRIGRNVFEHGAKVALTTSIVLGIAFPASAAIKNHRGTNADPTEYNALLETTGTGCSPIHTPLCSNICTERGPCAPPDGW